MNESVEQKERPSFQEDIMANLMITGKAPSFSDRAPKKNSPSSPSGSISSLSPMTGQPRPFTEQKSTPSSASTGPASPLPHPFGDSRHSPQSPQSPTFALPALRSASLSPQPPGHRPMKSHSSSSSSSLLDGSKTVPRPTGLGLGGSKPKRPELKNLFYSPTPPKKFSEPTMPFDSPVQPISKASSHRQVNKAGSTEEEQFEELKREKMGKFKFAEEEPAITFDLSDMVKLEEIGRGITGQVYRMRHQPTGRVVAAKQMEWSGVRGERKRVLMDLDVMTQQHSSFIVQYYGSFIQDNKVWLFMELMDSCIDSILRKTGPIPEPIIGTILVSIIQALDYLKQKHKIIHRDVKPSNMLVSRRGQVKLCDFGISGHLVDSKVFTREAGVPAYMAPERISNISSGYTVKADVWSLGISVVQMVEGKLPYPKVKTEFELLSFIVGNDPPLPDRKRCSPQFYDFLSKCLTKDETLRPEYSTLFEHPFIVKYRRQPEDLAAWVQSKLAAKNTK